jgi:hypothetical protein
MQLTFLYRWIHKIQVEDLRDVYFFRILIALKKLGDINREIIL